MNVVVLVCGVQASGKSWICRQLVEQYHYVPHDRCWKHPFARPRDVADARWGPPGSVSTHLETIVAEAGKADRPVLTEVPFDEKRLKEDLEVRGFHVVPVFVVEDVDTIRRRYHDRERKRPPRSVLTRAAGLAARAGRWHCFAGTSAEVLAHLKDMPA